MDRYACVASASRPKSLPPLLHSIDIFVVPGLLPLFFAPPDISEARARRRLIHSSLAPRFSLSRFLVPLATVPRSFEGALHHDEKLNCCCLGDKGSLRSVPCDRRINTAACTTAKSNTKKLLMIGDDLYWLHSRVVLCPIPCVAPPLKKTSILSNSAGMLHGTEALQCLSLHTATCRHFQSLCPCCIAVCSTSMRSAVSFIFGTSSVKMIRKPLHPPFSTGCEDDSQAAASTFVNRLL